MRRQDLFKTALLVALLAVLVSVACGRDDNGFDLTGSLVPADQIHLGGPPRDGIPSIDRPRFVAAQDADFISDTDRVLGLARNGRSRAYPIAIMNWHEVVNDRVGGESIAVTYCPLCGTGVAGPLKGERLTAVPLTHTSWRAWRAEHPDTQVLSADTGSDRDYERDPYAGYTASSEVYFPVSASSRRYHPKERVLGLEVDGRFKAYPFAELSRSGDDEISDSFAGRQLTIRFDPAAESARVFGENGAEVTAVTGFWFAWYAFHPETEVYTAGKRR